MKKYSVDLSNNETQKYENISSFEDATLVF